MKHKTLICMHTAIYYGCNEFNFQKTDTSLTTKVTWQLNVIQPETNLCHQTVLFGPYLQKRPTLSTFLGFCNGVVEVSILLGYDIVTLRNWAQHFRMTQWAWNYGIQLHRDAVPHPRRTETSDHCLHYPHFYVQACYIVSSLYVSQPKLCRYSCFLKSHPIQSSLI